MDFKRSQINQDVNQTSYELTKEVNFTQNTYHRTIKEKPVDVKDNTYIDSKKEVNNKNPKFKVGDHVGIPKNKNIFATG